MTFRERAEAGKAAAYALLREKSVRSTVWEKIYLADEAWDAVRDLPQPLQQSRGLAYMLERVSLPTEPYDLLVGRFVDRVLTDEEEARFQTIVRDRHPNDNPITQRNVSHTTFDWEAILTEGLGGLRRRAAARLEKAVKNGEDANTQNYQRGIVEIYDAITAYIRRYADAADAAGLADCAASCRSVAEEPPVTFRDALQLVTLITVVYLGYAAFTSVGAYTLGRLDDLLLPLYEADLAAGRLTREDAGWLLDDFYVKTDLYLGRGEHQMSGATILEGSDTDGSCTGLFRNSNFDTVIYLMLDGYSVRRDHRKNPLTLLMAEHISVGFKNPVFVCRHTADADPALWDVIYDRVRNNASILIYNDETVIPAMKHAGISDTDAIEYTIHPCNWPDVNGGANVLMTGGFLSKYLMEVLAERTDFTSVEELIDACGERFRETLKKPFADYRAAYRSGPHASYGLLSVTECFLRGTADSGRGMYDGGVRYPFNYNLVRGIGTATDILAAIDRVVFQKRLCTLPELMQVVSANYEGHPDLLAACRHAPKYGTDDPYTDALSVKLMNRILDVTDEEATNEKGEKDVINFNVTITDMSHLWEGSVTPATPDGRLNNAPLSENLSPTVGCMKSVTGLLNSVARLPAERLNGGAFNVRLSRDVAFGEGGPDRVRLLLDTYFAAGGMQIQVSVADTAMLRAAQEKPEEYRDLTVRITGYSAIFTDMSRLAQNEIIRRDELNG